MSKNKEYVRLINSQTWKNLRACKLGQNPLCERCFDQGIVRAATEVHHKTPVEWGVTFSDKKRLAYNVSNLQSLCHSCHVAVHTELGRSSKEGTRKRTEAQRKEFRLRFLS